jgi:hypothetical protein
MGAWASRLLGREHGTPLISTCMLTRSLKEKRKVIQSRTSPFFLVVAEVLSVHVAVSADVTECDAIEIEDC